jgi:hypothetical protein
LLLVLSLCAAAVFPLPAGAAGAVDPSAQNMGPFADSAPVSSDLSIAQTFTPSLSGALDTIALSMGTELHGAPSDPLLVQIEPTLHGLPTGDVLASALLSPANVTGVVPEYPLTFVAFASPAAVTAGTQYAVVLTTHELASPYVIAMTDAPSSGGQLLINGGAGWTRQSDTSPAELDLRFQTLITRSRGTDPWPIRYANFGAYSICDFDDGTRDMCPDQAHAYLPCFLSDGRTVLCADRDLIAP